MSKTTSEPLPESEKSFKRRILPRILFFCDGFLWGAALMFLCGVLYLRSQLILETPAPADFDQVVNRIPSAVTSIDGWTVTREQCQLPKTIDGEPLAVFKLCNGDYAGEMLRYNSSRKIACALPCAIAVYRKKDGKTYLAKWNMPLTGRLLGGAPAELFPGRISEDQSVIMARICSKQVEKTK